MTPTNGERDNCFGYHVVDDKRKCFGCGKTITPPTPAPPPETVTAEAERLVSDRRGPDYGHPLDNHTATAEMWSAYLRRKYGVKIELDADDVCWMNIFQKASRDANAPKRDNLTDTAGYALNIDMIRAERDRRDNVPPP